MVKRYVFTSRVALLFLIWLSAYPSLAQKVIPVDTSHAQVLRIDPSNAFGGTAKEVLEDIEYIPLETTKESLFGQIDRLEVTDEHFVILDKSTNSILFFDRRGRYKHKIYGGNPNMDKSCRILSFAVNNLTKELVYPSWKNKEFKYMVFDFQGKKVREIPRNVNLFYDYKFIGKNEVVVSQNYQEAKEGESATKFMVNFYKDLQDNYANIFPYQSGDMALDQDYFTIHKNFTYGGSDTAFLFTKPQDYNVYKITPKTASLLYKYILPAQNSLPKGFLTDSVFKDKRLKLIQKGNVYFNLQYCYLMAPNLIFHLSMWDGGTKEDDFIYNLKSGQLFAYNHISTDETAFFLPLSGDRKVTVGFAASDGEHLFTELSSREMFRAQEEHKDKNIKYNPILQQYFSKGTERDNPVILQLRLKDKL